MINAVRSRVFRYGLIYMGLFLASVLVIFLSLYLLVFDQVEDLVDEGIRHDMARFSARYENMVEADMIADLNYFLISHPGYYGIYVLENAAGQVVAGNLERWPQEDLSPGLITAFILDENPTDEEPGGQARATVGILPGNYRLLVGRNYTSVIDLQGALRQEALFGLQIAFVLGLIVAIIMARSLSRRLERINRTSQQIMDAGLDIRMPLNGSGDEFDRLAVNLNRMLDRIRRLMESMEGVTDNIAHDLRTPLTRLKSRMEVGLLSDRSSEAYQTILAESLADTDRILDTFNSLLAIAKVRAGTVREDFERLDLAQVVAETGAFYEPVAVEKGQTLVVEADGPAPVIGSPGLLAQAVANLVDNAVKFTPPEGRITLQTVTTQGMCEVRLRDTGPGIPEDFRERAFERFARQDVSRQTPGQGLGLSLVQVVVELHDGAVTLEDGVPGLLVRLELPRAES